MEYFVISTKFVPLKYYTLSSQLRRLTLFSVGLFGSANSVTRSYPVMWKSCIICSTEEQVTLAQFIDQLDPWVPTLQLLASLHEKAVVSCTQPKCVYRVCHLLKTVQESIMEQYSMGESTQEMVTDNLMIEQVCCLYIQLWENHTGVLTISFW